MFDFRKINQENFEIVAAYPGSYQFCIEKITHASVTVDLNFRIGHEIRMDHRDLASEGVKALPESLPVL